VRAFDALAPAFDDRFAPWRSVAAQRRAVRRELVRVFPEGSHLLELGGGTGEDALYLASVGRRVTLTDGSPEMVARASAKAEEAGLRDRIETSCVVIEELSRFAKGRGPDAPRFDGCFSNFASLNCVEDLGQVGLALATLLPPGAHALLVVFGPFSPGEILVLAARGQFRSAFRRFHRGPVAARVSGREFSVRYPRPREVERAFSPYFRLRRVRGVGVAVPPSSAEPGISRFPRLVSVLEGLDRVLSAPLGRLGDHVLLDFERTDEEVAG